ncbi:MAG: DUF86 domain-containing protein [Hydrogenophilales bacterium]|nr:DUF86 domain-containing protein [Hydrogenophilales bacterium]
MTQDSIRVADYLEHIAQAIQRIKRYTDDMSEVAFLENELVQDAVIRNIEIIGEAARNIERNDPVFAARHAEIPWEVIYAMRNRVAHGYPKVDLEIVWKTIQADLPALGWQISKLTPPP